MGQNNYIKLNYTRLTSTDMAKLTCINFTYLSYDTYYSGKLIVSYERATISDSTLDTINKLSSGYY
jgi:hypothetical protein